MNLDRLISRIRSALRGGADAVAVRALAEAYCARCKEAAARMESCLPLLHAGQKYAALQIAETQPPLLDLVAKLAFDGMDDWQAFCAENDLPQPPVFDAALVAQINALYGERIDETHPLYRDYRAAMRLKDEVEALRILNAILRVNPDDENARAEALRLEPRAAAALRLRAERALAQGAPSSELETLYAARQALGLGGDGELWREISRQCARAAEERAQARAAELLERLRPAFEARDWEAAMPLLAQWESLELSEAFAAAHAEEIDPMRAWAQAEAAARAESAAERRRTVAASALVSDALPLSFGAMEDALARLRGLCAAQGKTPWPPPLDAAIPKRMRLLRVKIARRRLFVFSGALALFAGLVAGGCVLAKAGFRAYAQSAYYARLESLRDAGDLSGLAAALDGATPELREARPDVWRAFDEWRLGRTRTANAIAEEIEALAAQDVGQIAASREDYANAERRAEALMRALDALPESARAEYAARIAAIRRAWTGAFEARESAEKSRFESAVERAEFFAGDPASLSDDDWRSYAELLPELRAGAPQFKELGERARKAADAYVDARANADAVKDARSALDEARDLPAYLDALRALEANPLTLADTRAHLQSALASPERLRAFLSAAATGTLSRVQKALNSGDLNDALVPRTTIAAENLPLSRLFGDKTVERLERRVLTTYDKRGRPESEQVVYTVGEVETERNVWSGGEEIRQTFTCIDESGKPVARTARRVKFRGEPALSGQSLGEPEVPAETRLWRKLRRYFDARANAARGPLLEALDIIRADTKASPIFKAALHAQWLRALKARPEVWGLAFCPDAERDGDELALIAGENPPLYAFVSPEKQRLLGAELAAFYARRASAYLPAARAGLAEARARFSKKPLFAGYQTPQGEPRVFARPAWYFDADGAQPRALDAARAQGIPPYTPFFTLPESAAASAAKQNSTHEIGE